MARHARAASRPLRLLGLLLACALVLRLCALLAGSGRTTASDLAFRTVVAPEPLAPASPRDCARRYDGRAARESVRLVDRIAKPVTAYAVEWDGFVPIPRFGAALGRSSIDFTSGTKPSLVDHVTCRRASVRYDGGGRRASAHLKR